MRPLLLRTHGDHCASLPPPDVTSSDPDLPERSLRGKMGLPRIPSSRGSVREADQSEKGPRVTRIVAGMRSRHCQSARKGRQAGCKL